MRKPYNATMNPHWKRWVWRLAKSALVVLMFFFIARQFAHDLSRLKDAGDVPWRPGWLIACAGLYLIGLYPTAWFWRRLLHQFGYPMPVYAALRAHYIAQLGKYVPGKALAILIRSTLAHPFGVPYGVSVIATFYEVLTGMAAGAIVAAVVYMVDPPIISAGEAEGAAGLQFHPLWTGVALVGVCGVPLLPGVFNFIVARLSRRIQAIDLYRLPPMRFGTLAVGLLFGSAGWCVLGLSCWALLQAVLPTPPELTLATWSHCTAAIGFANVAGFVIIFIPGGLGVREILLLKLLSAYGPSAFIALSAILLRLDWILTEAVFGLIAYLWKPATATGPAKVSDSLGVKAPP